MSVSPFVNKAVCVSWGNNAVGTTELRLNGTPWTILHRTNGRFSRVNEPTVLRNFATNCDVRRGVSERSRDTETDVSDYLELLKKLNFKTRMYPDAGRPYSVSVFI